MSQNLTISTTGFCAGTTDLTCLGSRWGNCCSQHGFCGANGTYCGAGCQQGYGDCYANADIISVDGSCGATVNGTICLGSIYGNCCSQTGFCGNDATYCGSGCQSEYGDCGDHAASATISLVGPVAPTSSISATSSSSTLSSSTTSTTFSSGTSYNNTAASTSSPSSGLTSTHEKSVTSSAGFKAGISIAAVVLLVIIAALIWFFVARWRRLSRKQAFSEKVEQDLATPVPVSHNTMYPTKPETESAVVSRSQLGGSQIVELPTGYFRNHGTANMHVVPPYEMGHNTQ